MAKNLFIQRKSGFRNEPIKSLQTKSININQLIIELTKSNRYRINPCTIILKNPFTPEKNKNKSEIQSGC
jgi:hypothetical protein